MLTKTKIAVAAVLLAASAAGASAQTAGTNTSRPVLGRECGCPPIIRIARRWSRISRRSKSVRTR